MRMGITGLAVAAAMALTSSGFATPAAAASDGLALKASQQTVQGDEFSSRRRQVRHYRGNAGAARAFGAIAGTIGGIVAAEQARRYYYRPYPYAYYGPYGGYYGGYAPYGYYGY